MSLTDKEIYPIYVSLVGVLLLIVGVGMAIFGITNLTDMWVLQVSSSLLLVSYYGRKKI